MSTGRPDKWCFPWGFALMAACGGGGGSAGASETDDATTAAASDDSTTGEPLPPLDGVADLHLHMFAEEAFGGGWFHGSHAGEGDVALAPCDGGDPGDHARLRDDLAPLLGACETPLDELAIQVPLIGAITAGGGGLVGEFVGNVNG